MSHIDIERRHEEAEARIRTAVMNELCEVMHREGLPPVAVLRLAARSIGAIYRGMAAAHSSGRPCPCGWNPRPELEVELLAMALMTACRNGRRSDLSSMQVAGNA